MRRAEHLPDAVQIRLAVRRARAVVGGGPSRGGGARRGAPRCASATGAVNAIVRTTAAAAPPAAITSFVMFIRLPREVDAPNSESLPQGNVSWNGSPGYCPIPAGIGRVTFPVAAHSVPRVNVVTKAGVCTFSPTCPRAVPKTCPLPYSTVHSIGSSALGPTSGCGARASVRLAA